jgi:hypothetical protein
VQRGEIKRLVVFIPAGSAKSIYTSVRFASWYLLSAKHQEPNCKELYAIRLEPSLPDRPIADTYMARIYHGMRVSGRHSI